jgi:uncharacterized protein DUF5666
MIRTTRNTSIAASIALGLALSTLPATAQSPQAPADSPGSVPAPGNAIPAVPAPSTGSTADSPAVAPTTPDSSTNSGQSGMIEGSVKRVDPGAGTLQVSSGPGGMFGRTVEVTSDTQIQIQGREGTLADLQEGSSVKASYETRDGKTVATRIEVVPAQ